MLSASPLLAALLLAALAIGSPAHAHAPGLSKVELTQQAGQLTAHVEFSTGDIDALLSVDTDGNGAVNVQEFNAGYARIEAFAREALRIRSGDQMLPVDTAKVTLSGGEVLDTRLTFQAVAGGTVTVTSPVLSQLPLGHRQHVSVRDSSGRLLVQRMLSGEATFDITLSAREPASVFVEYVVEGVWHILIGFDHILFLLTLLLPATYVYVQPHRWQPIAAPGPAFIELSKCVTAFTAAHSITLTLATLGLVVLPSRAVESLIAVSVIVVCLNNLYPVVRTWRWTLAFVFGLVHGFGFAGVLVDLGLGGESLTLSLFGFNLGVELGQLAIVALASPLGYMARSTQLYRTLVFRGGSVAAAALAGVWLVERAFDYELVRLPLTG